MKYETNVAYNKECIIQKESQSTTLNALIKTYSIDTKIGWCVKKKKERERYMQTANLEGLQNCSYYLLAAKKGLHSHSQMEFIAKRVVFYSFGVCTRDQNPKNNIELLATIE